MPSPLCSSAGSDTSSETARDTEAEEAAMWEIMRDDLAVLNSIEAEHRERRAREEPYDEISLDGNVDVVSVVSPSTLGQLPRVILTAVDIAKGPSTCTICMDGFSVGQCRVSLPCMHLFHDECVAPWLGEGRDECPLCRASVSSGLRVAAFHRAVRRPRPDAAEREGLREVRLRLSFQYATTTMELSDGHSSSSTEKSSYSPSSFVMWLKNGYKSDTENKINSG